MNLNQPGGDLIVKEQAFFFRLGSTITAYFAVGSSSWTSFTGSLPIPSGQWTHLAITFDSTSHIGSIYVNGVLDTTMTMPTGTLNQATSTIWIGRNDYNSGSAVNGKIDSFRISKVARQFLPLYPTSPGVPTPPGNLVPNGDFEMGLIGWRGDNYGDVNLMWETTGGAASGQKCLHSLSSARTDFATLLPADGGSPCGVYSRPIPTHPGRKYTLSMRLKAGSSSLTPRIEVNSLGTSISAVSPFPQYPTANTGSWSTFTQAFTLSSTLTAPNMCVHISYPSSSDLYVDDVRLIASDGPNVLALKDKISVGPASTLPAGNVFTTGTASPITLNITNTDTVAHTVTVQPTITDWEGTRATGVPSLGSFTVPAGGVKTTTYTMDATHRGSCVLGFDLTSEGQTWHQLGEMQYAMVVNMQGVGSAATSIFGMNMHMEREPSDHLARETQVLAQCGVKWIRAWWGWGMCENPEGTYSFTEYDRQYNAVSGAQMSVMSILLRYYPQFEDSWAGSTSTIQQPPSSSMMGEWGIFCGKVAQHYLGKVGAYEIWNEPTTSNNGAITASIYAQILNAASLASGSGIRAYDTTAPDRRLRRRSDQFHGLRAGAGHAVRYDLRQRPRLLGHHGAGGGHSR